MYSRIARAKFDTTKSEDVIKVAKEAVGTTKRLSGFRSVTYHYDRASGWGFAVSMWDTKEQADAAAEKLRSVNEAFAPYRTNKQHQTADVVAGPLPSFEVVAQG